MGVDPGIAVTGYGIVEASGLSIRYRSSGCIRTDSSSPTAARLVKIVRRLREVIEREGVECISVEAGFVGPNAQSALKLGQARAAALLAGELEGIEVCEYAPREVKMALTGRGSAAKKQVQFFVQEILGLIFEPNEEDISDALALAICHAMRTGRPVPRFTE
ncbi:MAG: crossover junction endodeoxyribonuclease RuvC [bacterium]